MVSFRTLSLPSPSTAISDPRTTFSQLPADKASAIPTVAKQSSERGGECIAYHPDDYLLPDLFRNTLSGSENAAVVDNMTGADKSSFDFLNLSKTERLIAFGVWQASIPPSTPSHVAVG